MVLGVDAKGKGVLKNTHFIMMITVLMSRDFIVLHSVKEMVFV